MESPNDSANRNNSTCDNEHEATGVQQTTDVTASTSANEMTGTNETSRDAAKSTAPLPANTNAPVINLEIGDDSTRTNKRRRTILPKKRSLAALLAAAQRRTIRVTEPQVVAPSPSTAPVAPAITTSPASSNFTPINSPTPLRMNDMSTISPVDVRTRQVERPPSQARTVRFAESAPAASTVAPGPSPADAFDNLAVSSPPTNNFPAPMQTNNMSTASPVDIRPRQVGRPPSQARTVRFAESAPAASTVAPGPSPADAFDNLAVSSPPTNNFPAPMQTNNMSTASPVDIRPRQVGRPPSQARTVRFAESAPAASTVAPGPSPAGAFHNPAVSGPPAPNFPTPTATNMPQLPPDSNALMADLLKTFQETKEDIASTNIPEVVTGGTDKWRSLRYRTARRLRWLLEVRLSNEDKDIHRIYWRMKECGEHFWPRFYKDIRRADPSTPVGSIMDIKFVPDYAYLSKDIERAIYYWACYCCYYEYEEIAYALSLPPEVFPHWLERFLRKFPMDQ